jgi:hypothetical protein
LHGPLEHAVTVWIVLFFLCGAAFGLATFSNKHLFSEGPERPRDGRASSGMDGRLMWVLICSCLWPVMALTGLYSFWRLRRVRVQAQRRLPHDQGR